MGITESVVQTVNTGLFFCLYLCQALTDLRIFFTMWERTKFQKHLRNIFRCTLIMLLHYLACAVADTLKYAANLEENEHKTHRFCIY